MFGRNEIVVFCGMIMRYKTIKYLHYIDDPVWKSTAEEKMRYNWKNNLLNNINWN